MTKTYTKHAKINTLSKSKSYDDWLNLVDVWRQFTTLQPEKSGPEIVLTLEGEAQDAVLKLETHEILDKDEVNKNLKRQNKFHKKKTALDKNIIIHKHLRHINTDRSQQLETFQQNLKRDTTKPNPTEQ